MTKNTFLPSLLLAGATLLGASRASASVPLGDGAEGFLTLKAGLEYNDNLFMSSDNETNDTIFRFAPGVEVLFGQNSLAQGSFSYTEGWSFYNDNSNLDESLSDVQASIGYDNEKTKVDAKASFQQFDQPTRDTAGTGLVKRDVVELGIDSEYSVTEKTSVRLGVSYLDKNYALASFADLESVTVPVSYYYEVAPKLDASIGLTYKDNTLGNGLAGSEEYFYNVGARGDLAPKLTGEVRIGYSQASSDTGSDQDTIGIDSTFTYAFSPKTTFDANVSNAFGFSGIGQSNRTFTLGGGVAIKLSEQLELRGRLNYSKDTYTTVNRVDDFISANVGANYKYSEQVEFSAGYTHNDNSSDIASSNFNANMLSLSASLRY